MHYRNKQFGSCARSTRYDAVHSQRLYELFNGDNYNLFQLCYSVVNNDKRIIFTHAGITKYWIERCEIEYDDNIEETINNLENSNEGIGKLCVIGNARSWFGEKTGSPLWCDIREFVSDKSADKNVLQIFGHTRLKPGTIASRKGFKCVDSQIAFLLNDKNIIRKVR